MRRGLILQHGLGDVIAVAGATLVGVGWAHAVAAMVKQTPAQERGRAPQPAAPLHRLGRELSFYRLEQRGIENGLVLTVVNLAPVDHLADIEAVLEQMGERPHAKAPPADGPAIRPPPPLAANSPAIEILRQRADGAELEIAGKDRANRLSLGWYHKDLLVHGSIAEWDRAADPNAFAFRGSDLVAHPLPDQLAFKLGKGQQDIEREPPHAGAGIEGLGHRHKRDVVGIEQLDELGEISQRAGQPVDLVNQHNVNLARLDIGQELLQRRAVERGAGECAVVVAAGDQPPAFVRLALYICLAGLALGVERVEGQLEIVLGRLTRIDGAARELADGSVHATERPSRTRDGSSPGWGCERAVPLRRRAA